MEREENGIEKRLKKVMQVPGRRFQREVGTRKKKTLMTGKNPAKEGNQEHRFNRVGGEQQIEPPGKRSYAKGEFLSTEEGEGEVGFWWGGKIEYGTSFPRHGGLELYRHPGGTRKLKKKRVGREEGTLPWWPTVLKGET